MGTASLGAILAMTLFAVSGKDGCAGRTPERGQWKFFNHDLLKNIEPLVIEQAPNLWQNLIVIVVWTFSE
jgi:hypothetical protein